MRFAPMIWREVESAYILANFVFMQRKQMSVKPPEIGAISN